MGGREKGQEGEEEKEKMKTEREEESGAEYMVRSNAAFSGETKFTLPYSSGCVCLCVCGGGGGWWVCGYGWVCVSSPLGRVTPNL